MHAIVTGVSGQDGWYMNALLARRGIAVTGLTHDLDGARAAFAGVSDAPTLRAFDFNAVGAFAAVLDEISPDYVFNFAAKATGVGMFDAPFETGRLNGGFILDILEAIRAHPARDQIRFAQSSSSEMFGNVVASPQDETTAFRPKSPYGCAKLYAHNLIGVYRTAYGVRASSLIFYNHESVRRTTAFVTMKIAAGAAAIKLGQARELTLGSLDGMRDWGYAPEYVEAMFAVAQLAEPRDFVVATGKLTSVRDVCAVAFAHVGLDYRDHVVTNAAFERPVHTPDLRGDAAALRAATGWTPRRQIADVIREMVDYQLDQLGPGRHGCPQPAASDMCDE